MEKIKKHDNLILLIVITIFSAVAVFSVRLRTGDEIWNFANIYKMVNGYQIYKDANVIITPIFFIIGEIAFKTIGANYFIFRILDSLIYSTMILIIYNILKQLKIRKRNALLYTLIIHYIMYTIVHGGANYNVLAILFVLLGIYITLKYNNTKKFTILNGIIIYLIIFTKQNIGVYYLIGTILMRIFKQKGYENLYKRHNMARNNNINTIYTNICNILAKWEPNRLYKLCIFRNRRIWNKKHKNRSSKYINTNCSNCHNYLQYNNIQKNSKQRAKTKYNNIFMYRNTNVTYSISNYKYISYNDWNIATCNRTIIFNRCSNKRIFK